MPTTDPIDVLLAHDRWATANLLQACCELSEEQFQQKFEMGLGTLQATATHILGAMRGWTDALAEGEPRERLEKSQHSAAELLAMHAEVTDEFESRVKGHPFDEIVTPSRGGRTYEFARGGIFPHVMTHSMHHRAQGLNMLRQLGVDPLPAGSVMEWMVEEGKRQ